MGTILEKLQDFGLTAKMPKCQWAMAECTYLGHVVGGGQVKLEVNKLEAVKIIPIPTTKKEVWSFLGLTRYYRHFVKDYASMTVLLTNLTRKEYPEVVVWTEECDKAFNALKNVLTPTLVLTSPDFERRFILQTNASNYGVSAVLSQTDAKGLDHPVAYFSHKLLDREQKYPTIEKEA